ncbi:hypothetical protein D3C76_1381550 [compost metagenome]
MRLHRAEADVQAVGDLLVALAAGHAAQHVLFARGQRFQLALDIARDVGRQTLQHHGEPLARRQRLVEAVLATCLRGDQQAEQFAKLAALELQQLSVAILGRQLQGLLQAGQRGGAIALVLAQGGVQQI